MVKIMLHIVKVARMILTILVGNNKVVEYDWMKDERMSCIL